VPAVLLLAGLAVACRFGSAPCGCWEGGSTGDRVEGPEPSSIMPLLLLPLARRSGALMRLLVP
jgi:hypothetical protein